MALNWGILYYNCSKEAQDTPRTQVSGRMKHVVGSRESLAALAPKQPRPAVALGRSRVCSLSVALETLAPGTRKALAGQCSEGHRD